MKISVILGVLQMSLGVTMKGFNALYFKRYVDFFFEFIPQIVLLLFFFGWMDTLIVGKWFLPLDIDQFYTPPLNGHATNHDGELYQNINWAPSVITTFIDIFLNSGSNTKADKNGV